MNKAETSWAFGSQAFLESLDKKSTTFLSPIDLQPIYKIIFWICQKMIFLIGLPLQSLI